MPSESAFECVCRIAADYFSYPQHALGTLTRVDDLAAKDEFRTIDFICKVETACGCDLPDFELPAVATLGQLAVLVEKHSTKEKLGHESKSA